MMSGQPIIDQLARISPSDLLATIALLVTLWVAYRGHKLSKSVAVAQVRPILAIYTSEYINKKCLTLVNVGVGTAIISKVKMSRGDDESKNAVSLFGFDREFRWDTFWTFQQSTDYLQAGERRTLLELTLEQLMVQGLAEEEGLVILAE